MPDTYSLIRCMGGRFCSHIPGTCTATVQSVSWPPQTSAAPSPAPAPSIQEQLGIDPISKLADAINNLADALRTRDASES